MQRTVSMFGLFTVLATAAAAAACGGVSTDQLSGTDSDQGALGGGQIARGNDAPCSKGAGELGCPPPGSTGGGAGGAGGLNNGSVSADAGPPVCHSSFVPSSTWQANFSVEANIESQRSVTVHGQACMSCHTTPATTNIPKFDFGGRVFGADGKPLARVEVQVKSTVSGNPISAYSNVDGYFWWPPPSVHGGYGGGGLGGTDDRDHAMFPSDVSVRTATGDMVAMCAKATNGDCGGCHGQNGVLPVSTKIK